MGGKKQVEYLANFLRLKLLLGSCLGILAGCSGQLKLNEALLQRLKNRGPVVINTTNPYLASNLYLRREREQSAELKGFLDHRGSPGVINVAEPLFGPLQMKLYYLDDQTSYQLEEDGGTWIISGPNPLSESDITELRDARAYVAADPSVRAKLRTQPIQAAPSSAKVSEVPTIMPNKATAAQPQRALPDPVASRLEKASKNANFQSYRSEMKEPKPAQTEVLGDSKTAQKRIATNSPGAVERKPANARIGIEPTKATFANLVKRYGTSQAELTPKGDLVHYITYPGENLYMIARWYTFDEHNAGKISRINGISDPSTLSPGDTVVVPKYLLKNSTRLSEAGLQAMAAAVR